MRHANIKLVTKVSDEGEPLETETFVTRPNITFALVYECAEFLANMKNQPSTDEIHMMIDIVTRIYDKQFTKRQLMDGLHSNDGTFELYKQIVFVGSGEYLQDEVLDKETIQSQQVNHWNDHKENLKATIQKMVKEGEQPINDVLDLPFYFVFDEINSKAKDKGTHQSSMLDAFR